LFAHNTLYCIEWNKFVGRLAGFYTWRSVKWTLLMWESLKRIKHDFKKA
jgi:hypothetical protein